MAVHLADWGLAVMDDEKARKRDAVLIQLGRLRRRGLQFTIPPIAGRSR